MECCAAGDEETRTGLGRVDETGPGAISTASSTANKQASTATVAVAATGRQGRRVEQEPPVHIRAGSVVSLRRRCAIVVVVVAVSLLTVAVRTPPPALLSESDGVRMCYARRCN